MKRNSRSSLKFNNPLLPIAFIIFHFYFGVSFSAGYQEAAFPEKNGVAQPHLLLFGVIVAKKTTSLSLAVLRDESSGKIKVLKVVAAHESGRMMNRLTAESQVVGGVTQGISTALFEERVMDNTTGNMTNPNFRDYKIATSMDIPEIEVFFVDMVDPRINNLGTKGLGEPPRIPIAAAIANAVYNAIGVHVREIPMTPDKVLQALRRKEVG